MVEAKVSRKDKAIFFDRDGVLNETFVLKGKPYAPRKLEDFKIKDSVFEILNKIINLNYYIFVITNQPDVGDGLVEKKIVEKMHKKLKNLLPIEEIFVCYHSKNNYCDCRKPKTGLLKKAKLNYKFNERKSYLVGDRFTDIKAGNSFNLNTILLGNGYDESPISKPDYQIDELLELNKIIF